MLFGIKNMKEKKDQYRAKKSHQWGTRDEEEGLEKG